MTPDRWIALISLAIGVVGIALAVYFYRRTEKRRIPTFVVSPTRSSLVAPGLALNKDFLLTYKGEEVNGNGITVLQVYFWNSGSLEILASQILRPYTISISGARILQWRVLRTNRSVIEPQITSVENSASALQMSFKVLEPGDGIAIEIIYAGPPAAKVDLEGACVGSRRPSVLPSDPVYFSTRPRQFFEAYMPFILAPVLLAIFMLPMFGGGWLIRKLFGEHVLEIVFFILLGCMVAILIVYLIADQYIKATRKYVPHDIRTE